MTIAIECPDQATISATIEALLPEPRYTINWSNGEDTIRNLSASELLEALYGDDHRHWEIRNEDEDSFDLGEDEFVPWHQYSIYQAARQDHGGRMVYKVTASAKTEDELIKRFAEKTVQNSDYVGYESDDLASEVEDAFDAGFLDVFAMRAVLKMENCGAKTEALEDLVNSDLQEITHAIDSSWKYRNGFLHYDTPSVELPFSISLISFKTLLTLVPVSAIVARAEEMLRDTKTIENQKTA